MSARFQQEVRRAEAWEESRDLMFYPCWQALYQAANDVLDCSSLSLETLSIVLDALALDDELEHIQDLLRDRPELALQVVTAAPGHPDYRARWQAAVLAGELAPRHILNRYLNDEDEYVRRRALLSMRTRLPEIAESIATEWLDAEHEYSRMVALDTLYLMESNNFSEAVDQLLDDPSEVVQKRLKEVTRAGSDERNA